LRVTAALLISCASLAGLLAVQLREPAPGEWADVPGQPPAPEAAALPTARTYGTPARAAFDEILKRPLFVPDRRPPAIPPPTAPEPEPQVELPVRLEGIATVGDTRVAVLRDLSNNTGLRLSEGMEFQGWKLDTIEAQRAVLSRGGQVQELILERQCPSSDGGCN
jgi:hypothetical protein